MAPQRGITNSLGKGGRSQTDSLLHCPTRTSHSPCGRSKLNTGSRGSPFAVRQRYGNRLNGCHLALHCKWHRQAKLSSKRCSSLALKPIRGSRPRVNVTVLVSRLAPWAGVKRKVACVSDLGVEKPVMANSKPDVLREAMIRRVIAGALRFRVKSAADRRQRGRRSFRRSGSTRSVRSCRIPCPSETRYWGRHSKRPRESCWQESKR